MNLYKITARSSNSSVRFIIATSQAEAVIKFLDLHKSDDYYHTDIQVDNLCKRDEIIPCVDPIKEFKNQ